MPFESRDNTRRVLSIIREGERERDLEIVGDFER